MTQRRYAQACSPQAAIDQAVSKALGASVEEVAAMGFTLEEPLAHESDGDLYLEARRISEIAISAAAYVAATACDRRRRAARRELRPNPATRPLLFANRAMS